MSVNPTNCERYTESMSPTYNPFDKPPDNDNSARIKALVLVQPEIIKTALTPREAFVIKKVICEECPQVKVARMLGINQSGVCRTLTRGVEKMRSYIAVCDKAIRFYQEATH